jgi:hypothetical protein
MSERVGFFRRLSLGVAVLFDAELALSVARLRKEKGRSLPPPRPEPGPGGPPRAEAAPDHREALHLLSIFQREGRLVDFLEEDIGAFSDAEVGAAARVVHEGCRKALHDYFSLEPVYREPEGETVVVEPGFDATRVRLSGQVVGEPPFRGSLKHHGWRVQEVRLPRAPEGIDPAIIAPAEVELP